ncbi:MAG: peptidoglycan-binding protein [Myxococcaceae bacterium]|nr:peptidoglycan-binding protein [Myxococcaceae bacterium]
MPISSLSSAPPKPATPVASAAATASPAPTATYRVGDKSPAIRKLQEQLIELGYLRAKSFVGGQGTFGPTTEKAVRQFQYDHDLAPNGLLNPATQARIKKALGEVRAVAGVTLEYGQKNEAVRVWQTKLVRAGYLTQSQMNTGPGTFGPATRAATRLFQQENGLNVSGRVGSGSNAVMTRYLEAGKTRPQPKTPDVRNISQLYSNGTEDDWNRNSNCAPASVAMIAKAFGFHTNDWSDGKLVNWLGGKAGVGAAGAGWPQVQTMARAAGLNASEPMFGADLAWVRSQLAAGKLVAANGNRGVTLAHSSYTDGVTGGHWVVVKGVDAQGNFFVEDPSTDCKKLSPSELARYFNTRQGGGVGIATSKP